MKIKTLLEQQVIPRSRKSRTADELARTFIEAAKKRAYENGTANNPDAVKSLALGMLDNFKSDVETSINTELDGMRVIGGGRKL